MSVRHAIRSRRFSALAVRCVGLIGCLLVEAAPTLAAQDGGIDPADDPATHLLYRRDEIALQRDKDALDAQRTALQAEIAAFNASCGSVPEDDAARVAACAARQEQLLARIAAYRKSLSAYKASLQQAERAAVVVNGGEIPLFELSRKLDTARANLGSEHERLLAELASLPAVEAPGKATWERVHEGVILGLFTEADDAKDLEEHGVSPFTGKAYAAMNEAASAAGGEGKDIGGALAVSFGTPEQKALWRKLLDSGRVVGDHVSVGQVSLLTPQGKAALERVRGKAFDRLVAHSNGASIAEALIGKGVIKVEELDVVGGDRSLLDGSHLQRLLDDGTVKRVVVWINLNDPVPWLSSSDQLDLVAIGKDQASHWASRLLGKLGAGDASVVVHLMWGQGWDQSHPVIAPHFLQTSYFPNIADEYGVTWAAPTGAK